MIMKDVTIVVRTTGERTTEACIQHLSGIFNREQIVVIENCAPFSEAIKKTFEIALSCGRKWTLVVDADIFVFERGIIRYIEECDVYSNRHRRAFSFDGYLYDKFLLTYRVGGGHLFRTKFLKVALKFIDESNHHIRPETFIKGEMQKRGFNCYVCSEKIGIHDFFQSYRDILRKGILHSVKHKGIDELYVKWTELQKADMDYYWICKGAEIGARFKEKQDIIVDINFFRKFELEFEQELNEQEGNAINRKEIKDMLQQYYEYEGEISFMKPWSGFKMVKADIHSRIHDVLHVIKINLIRGK